MREHVRSADCAASAYRGEFRIRSHAVLFARSRHANDLRAWHAVVDAETEKKARATSQRERKHETGGDGLPLDEQGGTVSSHSASLQRVHSEGICTGRAAPPAP